MSGKFRQSGQVMTVVATAAVKSGDAVVVGQYFGIVSTDAEIGQEYELLLTGVHEIEKVASQNIAQGANLYFDATEGELTTNAGTEEAPNPLAGTAHAPAPAQTNTVYCLLKQGPASFQ